VKKLISILVFAVSLLCYAQNMEMGAGMEVSGFRVPDYDDAGQLRAQLYGGYAKVLDGGLVEITNLKIEMYREGKVAMTLFAPHCFFNMETHQARSEGRVLIESEMMTVVGIGFTWSSEDGRFDILHDSKVLVKQGASAGMGDFKL
jgi:hypothetical protein